MQQRELRGTRYLTKKNEPLRDLVLNKLPYWDFKETCRFYHTVKTAKKKDGSPVFDDEALAFLGCNDRYFLLTVLCSRRDALHPWLFDRCREVEAAPDDRLDLWARDHYKSTIITFSGAIQEILCNPEITIAIFSNVKPVAHAFLTQIMQELERNETLKRIYPDVLWEDPRKEAPVWGLERGIVVKRRTNPKEATVEAHGLVDGQPISRHYQLRIYDDLVTDKSVTTPEMIRKTTEKWELSDNLASSKVNRRWHIGTRYHFGDTYGIIIEEGRGIKPRIYPATDDGTLKGEPVFLPEKVWESKKKTQRRTVAAQMLLNPVAGNEAMFKTEWLRPFLIRPTFLNIYIMCDPSKGATQRSDRTAIAVVGIDAGGNKYLLDGVRHRMKLSERYEWLKRMHAKWHDAPGVQATTVGYEIYGQINDEEVIAEWMLRDKIAFKIETMNTPRQGGHSKKDRVERLEPDMKNGKFHLPGIVHHADYGGMDNQALWSVWTEQDAAEAEAKGRDVIQKPGQIVYRPLRGPTNAQRAMLARGESHRIMQPIKRLDENNEPYDLTRAFIEEAMFFPFAPKDDLIDAVSRVYDLKPTPAIQYETASLEPVAYPDA
jgi:hypothetical protein